MGVIAFIVAQVIKKEKSFALKSEKTTFLSLREEVEGFVSECEKIFEKSAKKSRKPIYNTY